MEAGLERSFDLVLRRTFGRNKKIMKYEPFPATFNKWGFDFTLLERKGDIVLLQKTKPEHVVKDNYEVVRLKKQEARDWPGGKSTPAKEVLPESEKWGVSGWSYCSLAAAREKFLELTWDAAPPASQPAPAPKSPPRRKSRS